MPRQSLVLPSVTSLFFIFSSILLLAPRPLYGQNLPGQPRARDRWEAEQARFRALILGKVGHTITGWEESWNGDDAKELSEKYAEQATLFMPDEELKGREGIQEYFQTALPTLGHLSFSLNEFEPGGTVSMVLGAFHYRREAEGQPAEEISGQCLSIFIEEDGEWKIRSQVFRPDPRE